MPRPRSVTLLALLVLSIAAFNLLGVVSGVRRYTVLGSLPLSLPPAVLITGSAFWGVAMGLLAFGLWRLKPWARWGTLAAVPLYLAQFWIERLLFGLSDYIQTTIWFYVSLDAIILIFVCVTLLRPQVRRAFSP